MAIKQTTIDEVVESETILARSAPKQYGAYYENAIKFNLLIDNGIKSIAADRYVFAAFISFLRKHHLLACLSAVRLHHVQAMMNLRQVLEAGACAAYAIANPDESHFVDIDEGGILDPSQDLTKKRYRWLDEKYPDGSKGIRNLKDHINSLTAHANLVNAGNTFKVDECASRYLSSIFDDRNDFLVRTDIWAAANVARGLLDLFVGVHRDFAGFSFADSFAVEFATLSKQNDALKAEMMASEAFKKVQAPRHP